jgi:purine-binding chemotaxis protein CheW
MAEMNPTLDARERERRTIEEVYRRRARQLAERPADQTASATKAVLVFNLGPERYGIALSELAEVLPYRGCTAVPGTPAALLGVINLRGDIRPVADLRRLLDLTPADDSTAGYVVMLRQQGGSVGLKVDAIDQVCPIDQAQLLPGRDGAAPIPGSRLVKALTADGVILIDTGAALSGLGLAHLNRT